MIDEAQQKPNDRAQELEPLEPYLPGDEIYIEPVYFAHSANLEGVSATFVHEGDPDRQIVLTGVPKREGEEQRTEGDRIVMKSRVRLEARVPASAAPGTYRCRAITAQTHGGQNVAFAHDPSVEADWVFRVLEEPKTQPELRYW